MNQKKRHHYLAQTYLRGFCNPDGKVCVYLKDRPKDPWWADPETVAFEKYYYSQPLPNGGRDNNRLEDFFSSLEDHWPAVVSKVQSKEPLGPQFQDLLTFIIMHRVRVPTARDAVEVSLAESVRMTARHLHDCGELAATPNGLTFEYLDQHLEVRIDPHRSILAMADLARGVGTILGAVGFEILENHTSEDFITSDNPVIYFDPTVSPTLVEPYAISRERMDIEFMFPMTPRLMLWGHSIMRVHPDRGQIPAYREVRDPEFVRRANSFAARFANRMIFSNEARHELLVERYAGRSPVVSVTHLNTGTARGMITKHVFGKRKSKPKWKAQQNGSTSE